MILGCGKWTESSDIWSIACILIELYTGEMLFSVHEDIEHLAMIEHLVEPLSEWMVLNARPGDDGSSD